MKRIQLFLVCSLLPVLSLAQKSNEQLWLDYVVDYPFAGKYLFETEASYQTLLSNQDRWQSLTLTPQFEMSVLPFMDLISGVPLSYTVQKSSYNTFEARTMLGAKFYFTQGKRVETRATLRYEHRFFKGIDSTSWEISNRIRLRAELVVPINKKTYYNDKMWYAIFDTEVFYVIDKNVSERFANRTRTRLGVGYRLNYAYRFEILFAWQTSRDEIEQNFASSDAIIRLRFKHYLNRVKPAVKEGSGGN